MSENNFNEVPRIDDTAESDKIKQEKQEISELPNSIGKYEDLNLLPDTIYPTEYDIPRKKPEQDDPMVIFEEGPRYIPREKPKPGDPGVMSEERPMNVNQQAPEADKTTKTNDSPSKNDNTDSGKNQPDETDTEESEQPEGEHTSLSDEEKEKVREEHPDWPDEIIDAISSWKEYEVLNNANLKIVYIDGKPCLVRTDIDMEQKDAKGRTNEERIKKGLSPIGPDGKPIELHHIGQRKDSPLAELTYTEHNNNKKILHPYQGPSEVHGEGNTWSTEKKNHWDARLQQYKKETENE